MPAEGSQDRPALRRRPSPCRPAPSEGAGAARGGDTQQAGGRTAAEGGDGDARPPPGCSERGGRLRAVRPSSASQLAAPLRKDLFSEPLMRMAWPGRPYRATAAAGQDPGKTRMPGAGVPEDAGGVSPAPRSTRALILIRRLPTHEPLADQVNEPPSQANGNEASHENHRCDARADSAPGIAMHDANQHWSHQNEGRPASHHREQSRDERMAPLYLHQPPPPREPCPPP